MKKEQIKNYINANKRTWEANELTVEEIAERCLLDGEQLGVDRLNSTARLLQILKDRGVIKSWYHNGSYYIGEVTKLEKENAELKEQNKMLEQGYVWHDYDAGEDCYEDSHEGKWVKRDEVYQLTKAKDLLLRFIELKNKPCAVGHSVNMLLYENICADVKQFLKETKEND